MLQLSDLVRLLADSDRDVTNASLTALKQVGADPSLIADKYRKLLKDQNLEVRGRAFTALVKLDAVPKDALSDTVLLLNDPTAKQEAFHSICRAGTAARPYLPQLLK